MSKNLIVSLLSDQAVQNVMFIKQMSTRQTEYLFVSTEKMEKKGVKDNIKNVCKIRNENSNTVIVKENSINDIKEKLSEIDCSIYEKILVNITGGTKIMSIAVKEFFNDKPKIEFYYMPINSDREKSPLIVNLQNEKDIIPISCDITLIDYLGSYGVKIREKKSELFPEEFTIKFHKEYYEDLDSKGILKDLREERDELRKIKNKNERKNWSVENHWPELKNLFKGKLYKKEIHYLTGDWFEELEYFKIKKTLGLTDSYIKTGVTIIKGTTDNEIDVIYVHNYNLYTIECKTSVGEKIMNETIYKAKALQTNFGLTAEAKICTLSPINDRVAERAETFNIIVSQEKN